jgi:hypothetical protein
MTGRGISFAETLARRVRGVAMESLVLQASFADLIDNDVGSVSVGLAGGVTPQK